MRLGYLRHRLPQLNESDLQGVPAEFARYARELSAALHDMSRIDLRAMKEIDTTPYLLATLKTSAQSLVNDTLTTVAFDTVVDTMGWWAGNAYTPEAGFYRCAWGADFRDTAALAATAYGYAQCAGALAIGYGNGTAPEIGVTGETVIECDGTTSIKVEALAHNFTAASLGAFTPYRTWLAITYAGKRPLY